MGTFALENPYTNKEKPENVYGFNNVDIHGKNISMADYRGKVLLIVNTGRLSSISE
jgi:glutathione peroxidase-family protein